MSERWLWWAKRDLRVYDNAALRHIVDSDFLELTRRKNAWRSGNTGIPMVDACMRCLMTTVFLNFRMLAMLVATARLSNEL